MTDNRAIHHAYAVYLEHNYLDKSNELKLVCVECEPKNKTVKVKTHLAFGCRSIISRELWDATPSDAVRRFVDSRLKIIENARAAIERAKREIDEASTLAPEEDLTDVSPGFDD